MTQDSGNHARHELIARGIIIGNGAVLVNRSRNAKTGEEYCALPGGHVDPGESCAAAVRREIEEELNAEVTVGDLCFVSESIYAGRHEWDGRRHEVVLYFAAALQSELKQSEAGRIQSPEADKSFEWLALTDLPAANLLPRAAKDWLLAFFAASASSSSSHAAAAPNAAPRYAFHDSTQS